jgi:hypothetical protein
VADVITNSWTSDTDDVTLLGEAEVTFYEQFSTEAAITGITVNFSPATTATTPLAAPTWRPRPWSSPRTCPTSPAWAAPAC